MYIILQLESYVYVYVWGRELWIKKKKAMDYMEVTKVVTGDESYLRISHSLFQMKPLRKKMMMRKIRYANAFNYVLTLTL